MKKDNKIKPKDKSFNPGRRNFGKKALTGVLGGALLSKAAHSDNRRAKRSVWFPGEEIKPAVILNGLPTSAELTFAKQAGADYIEAWLPGDPTYDDIMLYKNTVEEKGLQLWSTDILTAYNSSQCILGLSGRDEKIEQLNNFLINLGKAGLHTTTLAWSAGVGYSTGSTTVRGGCTAREWNADDISKSLAYDREYSEEEIWDNLEYFLERVLPVAEDSGVRLAFHPCDPPMSLRGVHQILSSNAGYERMLEIGNYSKYLGANFCVGTWSEMPGPDGNGEDVIGAIHQLGGDHIYCVHFRNVSSPVPYFHETFVDGGYTNMYKVMKAFLEVGFTGTMVPDHVPGIYNELRLNHMAESGTAYTIGAIRMAKLAAMTAQKQGPTPVHESLFKSQPFAILSNHPNPFNPSTTIEFELPESGNSKLFIYNMSGQKVRELAHEYMTAGTHEYTWDGKDEYGRLVSSGVYIAHLRMGQKVSTKKMTLMK